MSNKKRLFEILDEMNIDDMKNGTRLVAVCSDVISANYKEGKGTEVTVGAPGNIVFDMETDNLMIALVLIDRNEYEKRRVK